ncbi:MAG TPA: tetratricopeptide repeat protein [Pirellulaceae bacterium]|nr:tetratricopeptide repeat protein [Pirellulaceae bacterium]HMO91951.1 tetratricopeptide repeat protein [Pirellulaceae bacterium]HMP68750.1 tetratricopeptide repeat protein [Pirellulaceae bacterium]
MVNGRIWIVSTLFALGVIVGLSSLLISQYRRSDSSHAEHDSLHGSSAETLNRKSQVLQKELQLSSEQAAELAISLVAEGDAYLIAGNSAIATNRFQSALKLTGRITNELSLRLAFSAELSSNAGLAADHYRRILANNPSTIHRWLALSGLSRTWIERGNRLEAISILADLFLESMENNDFPLELRAQVGYQLGRSLEEMVLQNYHFDATRPDGVVFYSASPRVEDVLPLIDMRANAKNVRQPTTQSDWFSESSANSEHHLKDADITPKEITGLEITLIQRPSELLDLMVVDIQSTLVPILELIKQLAATCQTELYASDEAMRLVSGRAKAIVGSSFSVSMLLDSLTLPLGIFWHQDENGLHLLSLDERPDLASIYLRAAFERTYRRFALKYPGDHRVSSSIFARANVRFIEGDLDAAATHYQELRVKNLKGELLAMLFYNVGKVEMRFGRNESAIRSFYLTVDQSYNQELQSAAYWLIGQLSLESNRLSEAIKTSGRALSLAQSEQQKRLAALTMARAYLLSNQPLSANQVLFENRFYFAKSELFVSASVLGSFARYVGMTDDSSINSEANRLLSAVANAKPDQLNSFIDIYIASRAWQELGFRDKAIEMLTLAASNTSILAWRYQILFELGVQLNLAQETERATAIFEFIRNEESNGWRKKALIQLAHIYLHQQKYKESLSACESLISDDLSDEDKQQTLNLMGRAYRQLGEHYSAALCFAGMIPK